MKKIYPQTYILIIIFLGVMGITNCSLFATQEQKLRWQQEENCLKNIYFVEEKSIQKPYKIVDITSITVGNGEEEYGLSYLKKKACEKKGDALTVPEKVVTSPDLKLSDQKYYLNITYTSKVLVWTTPEKQ